ncbi:MAG: YjjG family noncanonical pyrimidine nucleotidase [Clostridia bacterium]|nr:YjjG family noncanonical pyrimidine nucleotidase [Clostridia bacterium]
MITTLFWDIDDTLLDFKRGEATAIRQTFAELGIPVTEENVRLYSEINDSLWKRLERRELTRDEVLVGRFAMLFDELGVTYDCRAAQELYFSFLGTQHDYIPGARETLDALYGRYRMYAVSNGSTVIQNRRIADAGLDRYFDGIFLSQAIGAQKPDPAFFDACFAAIPGLTRDAVLLIGDSLTSDMRGGEMAGLCTCWFNPHGKSNSLGVRIDYEIATPEELLPLLNTLMSDKTV